MPVVIYKISGKRQQRWFVRDTSQPFHTQFGPIEDLTPGKKVMGPHVFIVVEADFLDLYKGMKRQAQIITRKDVGFIIGYCGLGKNSVVVESGAGSGGATIMLANTCKKVHSYEIEKENIAVVEKNLKNLDLKNVTITHADFYDESVVKVKDADAVLLDLPEPWSALASTSKALRIGGYVVAYTPTILQANQFVDALPEEYLHERTLELMDRDWKVVGRAVRPTNASIGHTAFLTFARKIL